MLTYSYLQGVEPPPRRPRDRCGETPSPLEKANAQLKRKRRRITNSAGVPAGTCICCTQDTTNFAQIFRVRDVTGIFRRAPSSSRPRTLRRSDGRNTISTRAGVRLLLRQIVDVLLVQTARWTGSSQNAKGASSSTSLGARRPRVTGPSPIGGLPARTAPSRHPRRASAAPRARRG